MSSQHPSELQLALDDVEDAFLQLEFAIKLLSHCELGKIDPEDFDSDHSSMLPEGTIVFPKGNFSGMEQLLRSASIGVLLAFSASILTLDQAFEVSGISCDLTSVDNIVRVRTLVYMMRNAHAHGIAAPCWKIKAKYQGMLSVQLGPNSIQINLSALDSNQCTVNDIGGYPNWYFLHDQVIPFLQSMA